MSPPRRKLGVLVDGTPLPEEEALALWERFSTWMEDHRGDLAGFAVKEGYASVHPGVDGDKPVLRASKSAAQKPYASVNSGDGSGEGGGDRDSPPASAGGSPARQRGPARPDQRGRNLRGSPGKPRK